MGIEGSGLPAGAGYMYAAYGVTALILAGYALSLWRKARQGSGGRGQGSGGGAKE